MSNLIFGQVCDGSLGDNIFLDGDFGSGVPNILPNDPNLAPGYTYQFNPPPDDGFYCITNNTSDWGSFAAASWVNIGDNSSDPNGYMMVVNASFNPGLFYEKSIDQLCGNTSYFFSADLINLITPGINEILPNVSFLIDGVVAYSTGNILETGQWQNYGFSFTTMPNQTNLTLALQNNAPGGNGNDIALDNISFQACGPSAFIEPVEPIEVCANSTIPFTIDAVINGDGFPNPSYQWQVSLDGIIWENLPGENQAFLSQSSLGSGIYYYRYLLAGNDDNLNNPFCRVTSSIKEIEVRPIEHFIQDTICEGLTYSLGDLQLATTGIYSDTLVSLSGCDSLVTLDLTIVPDTGITADFLLFDPSCSYLSNGYIALENVQNASEPFEVYVNEVLTTDAILILDLSDELVNVQIIDRYGCQLETDLQLTVPDEFIIDLGEDQLIDLGETIEITVNATETVQFYNWQPTEWVDCETDCEELQFQPLDSGYLILEGLSENDCIAVDSVFIDLNKDRGVYIPNIFSPNGDRVNDVFTVYANTFNVIQVENLFVFDRWGNQIFSQSEFPPNMEEFGWRPNESDRLVKGVYSYFIEVRFLDNEIIPFTGTITMI